MAVADDPLYLQLIYVSSASHLLAEQELLQILNEARDNNAQQDITGMLVYSDGTFIQVLEGPAQAVENLFLKIQNDPRHHRCFELMRQRTRERAFEGWSMGFRSASSEELEDTAGYIDFFSDRPIPERGAAAYRLLNSFRRQHDRSIDYAHA